MKAKKIAVLGSGAIGASAAACMAQAGLDVTLIDQWPAHVEAIRQNGLQVSVDGGTTRAAIPALHLCELAECRAQFDVVMIGVKAYDTRWTAELIKRHLAPDALVIGLQNSLCDEEIIAAVGRARVVGCVVELAAEVFEPGVLVRHTPPGKTWFGLGAYDAAVVPRLEEVAELLRLGARVSLLDDVNAGKWTKLIANAVILGPTALLGMQIKSAFELPGLRQAAAAIGTEAIAVAQACGQPIQAVFGLSAAELQGAPDVVARKLVDTIIDHIGPAARSAVYQDHLKGRYSEVDDVNGLVAAYGARHGIATPYNERVVALTGKIWSGELVPQPDNVHLLID
ncbi:MAG: ketopantoate reductase family protein [Janthinobacterium lividum]